MIEKTIAITLGMAVDNATHEVIMFADSPLSPERGDATDGIAVASLNFAHEVVSRLTAGGNIIEGYPPESDYTHLWHICLTLTPTHNRRSLIDCDYQRLPGCSNMAAAMMMDIYTRFRHDLAGQRVKTTAKREGNI